MNVWDYFQQEAKKKWAFSEVGPENILGFQQYLEYINYTRTGILEWSFTTIRVE